MSGLEIKDDGFIDVTIGDVKQSVDCYASWNAICDLRSRLADEDKPVQDFHAGVVDLLESLGFPRVSHRAADKFAEALAAAVDELKKNDGDVPTPGSPTISGPTPSPSAAG